MKRLRMADGGWRMALLVAMGAGCITHPQNPAATQPATAIDPQTALPEHWLDQPAKASASSADFQSLWNAAEDVARAHQLTLDRVDYRIGLLTTRPKVSPQFFEVWRSDAGGAEAWVESSIASIRRSVHFEFERDEKGHATVSPKVLVERSSQPERRITSVVQYRASVSPGAVAAGTRERDAGVDLPTRPYWYATGRDTELEVKLAEEISRRTEGRDTRSSKSE